MGYFVLIAYVDRSASEDEAVLRALEVTMDRTIRGDIRIVASQVIETEVRPGDLEKTLAFHNQLRACRFFESYPEGPGIRTLAKNLQNRLQQTGRKGGYADLIHVATAIASRSSEFWTTDNKVLKWYAEGVVTEIRICRPFLEQDVFSF